MFGPLVSQDPLQNPPDLSSDLTCRLQKNSWVLPKAALGVAPPTSAPRQPSTFSGKPWDEEEGQASCGGDEIHVVASCGEMPLTTKVVKPKTRGVASSASASASYPDSTRHLRQVARLTARACAEPGRNKSPGTSAKRERKLGGARQERRLGLEQRRGGCGCSETLYAGAQQGAT